MSPGNDDGPSRRSDPDTAQAESIDLAALRADDELIEALAAGLLRGPEPGDRDGPDSPDSRLVAMLEAWVADVRPETIMGRVGATVGPAPSPRPKPVPARTPLWSRYARHLALAAAAIVVATSGLAIGSADAVPGETLWEVSKVFYAERARSVEAAADVTVSLERARTALRAGHPAEAAQAIEAVRVQLDVIRPAEGHDLLVQQHEMVIAAIVDPSLVDELDPVGPSADPAPVLAAPAPSSADPLVPDAAVVPEQSAPAQPTEPASPAPSDPDNAQVAPPAPPSEPPPTEPPPSDAPPSDSPPGDPPPSDSPPSDAPPSDSPPSDPPPSDPPPSDPLPSDPPPSDPPPSDPPPSDPPPSDPPPSDPPPAGSEPPANLPALEGGVGGGSKSTPPAAESEAVAPVAPAEFDAPKPAPGGSGRADTGPTGAGSDQPDDSDTRKDKSGTRSDNSGTRSDETGTTDEAAPRSVLAPVTKLALRVLALLG